MRIRSTLTALLITTGSLGIVAAGASPAQAACPEGRWPATVQGQPTSLKAGAALGDYLWHDSKGWHLRVTHPGKAKVVFTGRIVSSAPLDAAPRKLEKKDTVTMTGDRKTVSFRFTNYGRIDGIDFRASCARKLTFALYANGRQLPSTRIVLGHHNRHPLSNPFAVERIG